MTAPAARPGLGRAAGSPPTKFARPTTRPTPCFPTWPNRDSAPTPNLPWWVASEASRALRDASRSARGKPRASPPTLAAQTPRGNITPPPAPDSPHFAARYEPTPSPTSPCPANSRSVACSASLVVNRETRYVLFEVGGRLEFPARPDRSRPERPFIELQRSAAREQRALRLRSAPLGHRCPSPRRRSPARSGPAATSPTRALALAGDGTLTFVTRPHQSRHRRNRSPPPSPPRRPTNRSATTPKAGPRAGSSPSRPAARSAAVSAPTSPSSALAPALVVGPVRRRHIRSGGVSVGGSAGLFRKADRR
jgi:hypothetical protein